MRFEFKLRIGPLAVEASDYDYFVPFQITFWRYEDNHGHSICNIRLWKFSWHGWEDKAQIRFTCEPRIATGRLVLDEPEEEWSDIIV